MSPIDCFATFSHYASHLLPIRDALPPDRRGVFYVPSNLRHEVRGEFVRYSWPSSSDAPLLVAGASDLNRSNRPRVLINHGAAQRYNGIESASYDGGPGRESVGLFLVPNQASADANLARYPGARAAVVGCPRLDTLTRISLNDDALGTVAVAFHWPCTIAPEAGWAWPTWRDALAQLSRERKVLGHCHPRARNQLLNWFGAERIEFVATTEELLARAEILIVDNSSLGMEWAACDRPVVFIDDASWDPNATHGPPRFGCELPGPNAGASGELGALVEAIDDTQWYVERRRVVAHRVYEHVDGHASERAAAAILGWEADGCPHRVEYGRTKDCGC